jgi:Fur family transcriptional regulator, zinc uptake regulator
MSHTHDHADLTRNQSLVLKALEKSDAPLTAYFILDQLRSKGIKAPLQVYRALEKLVEQGLVHRVESMSAFMACRHQDHLEHGETAMCANAATRKLQWCCANWPGLKILPWLAAASNCVANAPNVEI